MKKSDKNNFINIKDMPKIKSPFVRKEINGQYVVTNEVNPGYEWVFEDESVMAIEKLDGTNVSIVIEDGIITSVWNRLTKIPFFNKGKVFIIEGVLESYEKGYCNLPDGQWFGELIGPKVQGNPYCLDRHLWIPFSTFGQKHLRYKSWGKYPKDFNTINDWFKYLMPLYSFMRGNGKIIKDEEGEVISYSGFVEGVIFTHPDGRMAKLRKDMFPWFKGVRHKK